MRGAAFCVLVCLALVLPAPAVLRPRYPVKPLPPYYGHVVIIEDDSFERQPHSTVNDGTHVDDVPVSIGVLIGDVNGNAAVNAPDVSLTKAQVRQPVGGSNFHKDANASGTITATDVTIIKSNVGTSLPP